MELVGQVTGLCVVSVLLALTVRRGSPETALLLALAAAALALLLLGDILGEAVAFLTELGQRAGLSPALLEPLYKTVGIGLVVRVGAGLCRDAGESALAAVVETAGAVCALAVALPLLRTVLETLVGLMG